MHLRCKRYWLGSTKRASFVKSYFFTKPYRYYLMTTFNVKIVCRTAIFKLNKPLWNAMKLQTFVDKLKKPRIYLQKSKIFSTK